MVAVWPVDIQLKRLALARFGVLQSRQCMHLSVREQVSEFFHDSPPSMPITPRLPEELERVADVVVLLAINDAGCHLVALRTAGRFELRSAGVPDRNLLAQLQFNQVI